jgi:two-component system, NtrC family, sensor histidine kinase HydH
MKPVRISRRSRWAWLISTFVLSAALLGSSYVNHRRVVAAAASLSHGQGEDLLDHVRQRLSNESLDSAPLDSILHDRTSSGLRYIALVNPEGEWIAEAGTPIGSRDGYPQGQPPRGGGLQDLGGRYRVWDFVMRRPPPRTDGSSRADSIPAEESARGTTQERGTASRGLEERQEGRGRPRPTSVVIEYEPVVAWQLAAEARRSFALSAVTTVMLLTVTLGFWRLSTSHEEQQRRLEQQERLGMLGEMSAVLAHEIRNPLASLKGHAQLLAERLSTETPERKKADRIVQEAQRLEALTSDLLDFARSGPIQLRPADPVQVVEASVQEVGVDAFVVHSADAPSTWSMDERRMRQALTNIMRNAAQATPEGSRSEVSVAQENGTLVFAIRDHGPGVPAGDEKRIFSPFYTTRTSGTGLGLAVAQRVAEIHHGSITATNHPNGGAVFRIAIPKS